MPEETSAESAPAAPAAAPSPRRFERLLALGNLAALAFGLFIALGLLATVVGLLGEASALKAQARESARATDKMRTDLARMNHELDVLLAPPPAALSGGAKSQAAQRARPYAGTDMAVRAVKVRANAPLPVCVFRPGDGSALESCIRGATRS